MRQPCDAQYDSSDPFGSLAGGRKYPHTGSDWFANYAPAYAITDCVVTATGWHSGNGNYVAVQLPDGSFWSYIHLSEILCSVGQKLSEGQQLAVTGNTGTNSRGPHLHCSRSDSPQVYVGLGNLSDPWIYLNSSPVPLLIEEDMKVFRFWGFAMVIGRDFLFRCPDDPTIAMAEKVCGPIIEVSNQDDAYRMCFMHGVPWSVWSELAGQNRWVAWSLERGVFVPSDPPPPPIADVESFSDAIVSGIQDKIDVSIDLSEVKSVVENALQGDFKVVKQ